MSANKLSESGVFKLDEDRVAQALVLRGLLSPDEVAQCRPAKGGNPSAYLDRLVQAGLVTATQSKRLLHDLPAMAAQPIPNYQFLSRLGQGATGTVFKARQVSMNRLVAVKVLQARLSSKPEFLERLQREAHAAARLAHNNIVQAIDVGSAGNLHYFVMEYVEGVTIRQEMDRGKVYKEREAVDIVVQIAQALSHAHNRGLVHRDIKPANIILTTDGVAKLADLGMARETENDQMAEREQGLAIGTPYYMAPEQVEGQSDIDGRADIYALGATMYHMITGRPPFPDKKIEAVLQAHLDRPITPPENLVSELTPHIGAVIEVMMAKDRDDRYQTPDDLIIDLECLLSGQRPQLARRPGEEDDEEECEEEAKDEGGKPRRKKRKPRKLRRREKDDFESRRVPFWWLVIVLGLLGMSVLLNLVLVAMVRRAAAAD
jgi:serine/threonine protein kinase